MAVNVTSSGSGMQAAAATLSSPGSNLPRSHTVAGDGRHLSRMRVAQEGAQSSTAGAAAGQRHSVGGIGGPVTAGTFFMPAPVDVLDGQQQQQQQQHGSFTGQGGSSQGLHKQQQQASQMFRTASTPPPSPAMGRPSGSGHPSPGEQRPGGSSSPHGHEPAGVRASHSGGVRHSTGGGGAVTVFDRKVYVSVYADGPTKVLCFSDDPLWTGSSEADEGGDTLQLLSRLHHVARQLMTVDRQLELYQGAAYGLKPGQGSRAVPALLLMQHQQQLAAGGGLLLRRGSVVSGGGGGSGGSTREVPVQQLRQQELPVLLQGGGGTAVGSGSTATAALALLQQMGRPGAAQQQSPARGSVTSVARGSESLSADASPWPSAAATAALGLGSSHAYVAAADTTDSSNEAFATPLAPAARLSLLSPQVALTQSHISSRPLAGAAAAAAAGVRMAGGLLGAEGGLEGGVKLYYDKLTLLLDSQLPLGGNVKVREVLFWLALLHPCRGGHCLSPLVAVHYRPVGVHQQQSSVQAALQAVLVQSALHTASSSRCACLPACLQVKLVSARGLFLDSVLERLHGLQARLLLPNRRPMLSGVVQLGRSREQEVVWEHEEQFTEVRAAAACLGCLLA